MCFKLGMCFGGDDYYRATSDPEPAPATVPKANYKGYTTATNETGRKANNGVPRKDPAAAPAATRGVYGGGASYPQEKAYEYAPADEPPPKLPAAARNNRVADDTAVKQPAAAAPAAYLMYSDHVY